jgi:all-trans-retinol 13,14-reductase
LIPGPDRALEEVRAEIRDIPLSSAHLCLYVGVKDSAANLGIGGGNLWIHPSNDHDANAARVTGDSSSPFASLYISFPSAKDPDFERRHPGRATVEVVALVPYHWFERWEETRLSTRHFMNYQRGESYGLSGAPERFRLRCLTPRTPVRNLYLTGQDIVSLGVTGALLSGVVTASAVLRRNLIATLAAPAPKRAKASGTNRGTAEERPIVA